MVTEVSFILQLSDHVVAPHVIKVSRVLPDGRGRTDNHACPAVSAVPLEWAVLF
jgi:hypothetical protein